MANHASHGALPFPVKGARYTVLIPYLDADGDPTDPTTPDTEISKDDGAAADTVEEVSSPKNSIGMLTLTGAEMDCSLASIAAKAASGPKTTLLTLSPRVLPVLESGTAQAGAAGTLTLAAGAAGYSLVGCILKTTGGTGGGGTGGANNQARLITAYNTTTKVASVVPNWETTPSSDTTYEVLLSDLAVNALLANVLSFNGTPASGAPATLKDLGILFSTTISALTSQTVFRLTDAPPDNNALNNCRVVITDASTAAQKCTGTISAYTGSTKELTLVANPGIFTIAVGDHVCVLPPAAGLSAAEMRSALGLASANLDTQLADLKIVSHEGTAQAGGGSTITLAAGASATDNIFNGQTIYIRSGTGAIQSRIITSYNGTTKIATVDSAWTTTPTSSSVYLISPFGRSRVVAFNAGVIDATAIANDAITAAKIANDAITAAKIAADAITAAKIANDAISEIQSGLATAANLATVAGYLDTEISAILAKVNPLPADPAGQAAVDAALAAVQTAISAKLPAALVGGRIVADVYAINGNAAAAVRQALAAIGMVPFTVDNTAFTATNVIFEADDVTEATANHYQGRVVIWLTGALAGQVSVIDAYALSSTRGRFTMKSLSGGNMTDAPADNDTGLIV